MARFFVPRTNVRDNHATIAGEEYEHLWRVLRLGPGDRVTLFDDAGREHEAIIRSFGDAHCDAEILRSYPAGRESPLEATLALGMTKGEKMDLVVAKSTELGVDAIAPFVSTYTVPKLDNRKIEKRAERWQKIALSAAKQCGRARIPEIFPLIHFRELVNQPWDDSLKLLFWEHESQQTLKQIHATHRDVSSIILVIGPEGGFSVEEANLAMARGFKLIMLGQRILRAETAAVTALSLAQFLWGDMV